MYTRSISAYDPQRVKNIGSVRKHTSHKITPLVRFYEKSAGVETESTFFNLEEPQIEEICETDLLESSETSSDFLPEDEESIVAKKSQTCPDLASCAEESCPLPPLPIDNKPGATKRMTRALSKGQIHLKRTTTWMGVPVQKLLASPKLQNFGVMMSKKCHSAAENMLRLQSNFQQHLSLSRSEEFNLRQNDKKKTENDFIYQTDTDHCAFIRDQVDEFNTSNQIPDAPKRIMSCKVLQIINMGSDRDCEYELAVFHDGTEVTTQRGSMRKINNNLSSGTPQDEPMELQVNEPFSLTFAVSTRYKNTKIRDGLAKIGITPNTSKPSKKTVLTPTGYSVLKFDSKEDTKHHGITRFKLTKSEERKGFPKWFNIELVVDVKIVEEEPPAAQKIPWVYKVSESHLPEISKEDCDIMNDPTQVKSSQQHCLQGDYLTIYARGMAHPAWKRYWVSLEGTCLIFYDFTHKTNKKPMDILSLMPLQRVNKPSIDDCEHIGIARKVGITLQFNRLKAVFNEDVHFDDGEVLEGKSFVYCDSESSAVHWRRALTACITDMDKSDENKTGVDLRFLW